VSLWNLDGNQKKIQVLFLQVAWLHMQAGNCFQGQYLIVILSFPQNLRGKLLFLSFASIDEHLLSLSISILRNIKVIVEGLDNIIFMP
jgi:hypothetical protein